MTEDYQHLDCCCFSGQLLSTNEIQPLQIGCGCEYSCHDEEECICLAQHPSAYDKEGRLKDVDSNEPVFECNNCCACPSDCNNRIIQCEPNLSLEVFETSDKKGKGLRTNTDIPKGSFVIEYVGEAITQSEAALMLESLIEIESDNPMCYVFVTKEHFGSNGCKYFCINATAKGNEARFINHSCEPNLTPIPVRINSTYPHLALFTRRDVKRGEELTFSYGETINHDVDGLERKKCLCGMRACCGYLPFDSTCFES